jgi:membrane protease YdiL (CAAX protease family)
MIIVISLTSILAILLGFVRFNPKLPPHLFTWIAVNLLLVTTAEEAFFRGFLQKNLSQAMNQTTYGNKLAILLASILFGLAYYVGGPQYMLLATISGIGYGWVYERTKRIESSILTHFTLNLTHFLFFTYPRLANTL